jgi:hypothetical protein
MTSALATITPVAVHIERRQAALIEVSSVIPCRLHVCAVLMFEALIPCSDFRSPRARYRRIEVD